MSFHLLPYPPTQFVHHPNGGTKVICFLLSRDLEMRKDEGFLLVLVQVGVFLSEGLPKARVFLLHHSEHGLPMVFFAENGMLQVIEMVGFLAIVQVDVQ